MRAAVLEQFNQPWALKDIPDPQPGPGQVVIRIHASGVCGGDLHLYRGHFPVKAPIVGGHEPVGEIVALGPGVTTLRVGDRVGVPWGQRGCGRCAACQSGESYLCAEPQTWMHLGGGNRELMPAWAEGCVLLPEGVSYEEAAPIFCAGYTVLSGLRKAQPRYGERVAILGVGGLGHLALQMAKALGHEAIAVTSTSAKRDEARALGADEVVIAGDDPGAALRAVGGVDVLLSTVDHAAPLERAMGGLRPGGRLVSVGVPGSPVNLSVGQLVGTRTQLLVGTRGPRRDLVDALHMLATRKVKPVLEVYRLDQVNEVLERLAESRVRYRAVLQP